MKESYKTQRFINFSLINSVISFHKLSFSYLLLAFTAMALAECFMFTELSHYYSLAPRSE
ncbi:hypothetical protein FCV60_01175 [Vibrio sp. F13]|nr:hypothetical protein FCV49_17580 [Vibrio sp. F13]TKF58315.1 hypothetical protein FCV60_01175 [Vibrio sp. F13]TKF71194.1 hypothetical protein FCV59_17550 [Vibrio sp. F13]TKG03406.1 hypothetical protein FCV67_20175 [Vibrio sp. F13]